MIISFKIQFKHIIIHNISLYFKSLKLQNTNVYTVLIFKIQLIIIIIVSLYL